MSVETLLSQLDKVRKTGTGTWTACCPAHAAKSPSLAIRELADSTVLLHCFAGCGVESTGRLWPDAEERPRRLARDV
jgi:DNA primase